MFNASQDESILILNNTSGTFLIDPILWGRVLTLARVFGWRPDGPPVPAETPRPAQWGTDYLFRHGQRITTRDASALAGALTKALPDIPDHDARGHGAEDSLLARFSGPAKLWLQALIRFLDVGSFMVAVEKSPADRIA
jgi:hypothetical protein